MTIATENAVVSGASEDRIDVPVAVEPISPFATSQFIRSETTLDFSGWQFTGWGAQGDYVEIIGSGRNETITGTSRSSACASRPARPISTGCRLNIGTLI